MREITQVDIDKFYKEGNRIHVAKKEGRCQFGRRVDGGPRCENVIKPGDRYVDGAFNFVAGPWSRDRWCIACVRDEIEREEWLESQQDATVP